MKAQEANKNKQIDLKLKNEELIVCKISKEKHRELFEHIQILLQNLDEIVLELAQNLVDNEKNEDGNLSKLIIDLMVIKKDLDNSMEDLKTYPFENDQEMFDGIKKFSVAIKRVKQFFDSYKKGLKSYIDLRLMVFDLLERSGISIPEKSGLLNEFNFEFDEKSQEKSKPDFDSKIVKLDINAKKDANQFNNNIPIALKNEGFKFDELKSEKKQPFNSEKMKVVKDIDFGSDNANNEDKNKFKNDGDSFSNFGKKVEKDQSSVNEKKKRGPQPKIDKKFSLIKIEPIENFQEENVVVDKRDEKLDQLEKLRFIKERNESKFELENTVAQYNKRVGEFKILKVKQADFREYEILLNDINECRVKANEYEFKNENQIIDNETLKRGIDHLNTEQRNFKDKFERLKSELNQVIAKAEKRKLEAIKIEQDPQIKRIENEIEYTKAEINKIQDIYKKTINKYQNTTNEVSKEKLEQMTKESSEALDDNNIDRISKDSLKRSSLLIKNPIVLRNVEIQINETNLQNSEAPILPYMAPKVDKVLLYTLNENILKFPTPETVSNDRTQSNWALVEKSRQLRESTFGPLGLSSTPPTKQLAIKSKYPSNDEWLTKTEARLAEISELNKLIPPYGNGLKNGRFGSPAKSNINYLIPNLYNSGISNGIGNLSAVFVSPVKKYTNSEKMPQINNFNVLLDYDSIRNKYKTNMGGDGLKLYY